MLPVAIKPGLQKHLDAVRAQHQLDVQHGAAWVELPNALTRKYPNAGRDWGWQWYIQNDASGYRSSRY